MRMVARAMHSSCAGAPDDTGPSVLGVLMPMDGAGLVGKAGLGAGGGCGGFP